MLDTLQDVPNCFLNYFLHNVTCSLGNPGSTYDDHVNLQNKSRSINVRYIGGCRHLWKCILHLLSGHFQCWVQDFLYGNPGSTYDNHVNLQNKSWSINVCMIVIGILEDGGISGNSCLIFYHDINFKCQDFPYGGHGGGYVSKILHVKTYDDHVNIQNK